MKILVTGGAGFIGSHVVDILVSKNYNVIVVDNLSSGKKENINKNAKFYNVDIASEDLQKIFDRENPDKVIHLAAQSNLRKSMEFPALDVHTNVCGSMNVFSNCVRHKVKKVVFSSSGGARYGEPEKNPCPETAVPKPISVYGTSKICAEKYLQMLSRVYGLNYCILAIANVYGPRQNPLGEAGIVCLFCENMLSGKDCIIIGDGTQTRDFVYIADVAKVIVTALEKDTSQRIFNIGSGKPSSVNDIFNAVAKAIGYKNPPKYVPKVKGEVMHIFLDISNAKKELSYKCEYNLDAGLAKTVEWYRQNAKT
jgi:UDP-glucose 4-epimerase